MKLVNYKLQSYIEALSEKKTSTYFKEYLQAILEDPNRSYFEKCDYVGLSLQEVKSKIDSLSKNISELQELKRRLTSSLDLAKAITAEILEENGVDRIDGNIISSLTVSKATSNSKGVVTIKDESAVMGLGYVKFSVDLEAVEKALKDEKVSSELKELVDIVPMIIQTPAKVKVNVKRESSKSSTDELIIEEVA